jgi:hypothetical protein
MAGRVPIQPNLNDFIRENPKTNTWFREATNRFQVYSGTSQPTSAEVPENQWIVYNNTSSGKISMLTKIAGVVKNVGTDTIGLVNVKDYGAVGDYTTDDTTAIQAAITYAQSIVGVVLVQNRPSIYFPYGTYKTGTLTGTKHLRFVGDGRNSTYLYLKAGVATSLFVLNAENIGGTSVDDIIHYEISEMSLEGNRTNSTVGVSHGVYCPTPAWGIGTQYSPSVIFSNVGIANFTGNGVFVEANRNWLLADNLIVRYCNDNAFASYSYDHELINCSFGLCGNFGVKAYAGGMATFTNCAIFYNSSNVVIDASVNRPYQFIGGANDGALQYGMYSSVPSMLMTTNVSFENNSRTAANTYSDIYLTGAGCATLTDNHHEYNTQTVKYLVELQVGATATGWPKYDTAATSPFGTAVTNSFTGIYLLGDSTLSLRPTSASTFGAYIGSTLIWSASSTNFSITALQETIQSTNPKVVWYETDAGVDTGKWLWDVNGGVLTLSAMNDAENSFSTPLRIARTGATVTSFNAQVPFGLPSYTVAQLLASTPAASAWPRGMVYVSDGTGNKRMAISDGTNWRFPDGAIVS